MLPLKRDSLVIDTTTNAEMVSALLIIGHASFYLPNIKTFRTKNSLLRKL